MQWLHQMFVSYNCNDCITVPLTQYENNPIYQEITERDEYGASDKYDRVYIDMRRSKWDTDELEKLTRDNSAVSLTVNLKTAAEKKKRLRAVGYSQAEYWYILSNKCSIMTYKNYNISKADEISP